MAGEVQKSVFICKMPGESFDKLGGMFGAKIFSRKVLACASRVSGKTNLK